MLVKKVLSVVMVLALGVSACGGDGNGGGGGGGGGGGNDFNNDVAEAQARDLASDAGDNFENLMDSPSGNSALAALFGTYANALAVASATNQPALVADAGGEPVEAEGRGVEIPACVDSTANTVTWNDCDFGTYQIDGTVETSGDEVDVDLTITAGGVSNTFTGTLTVTATLIDGTLHVESQVQQVGFSVDIVFDNITLTGGCPTAGALMVQPSFTGNGVREVTATFGPECGDVQLSD